jgi:hypothetical protein
VRLYPAPSRLRPNDFRESLVLFSGQVGQVRALAKFALERQIGFESGMAVLHGSRDRAQSLAREVAGQFRAAGAKMVLVDTHSSSEAEIVLLARRLREQRINTILLAGAVDSISLNQLVPLLADQMEPLTILAPAVVATRWMRADPLEPYVRVLVASPVSSRIGTSTLAVVAAARLLVEGLKEAGRDLDRETFIKAMERASYPSAHDSIQIAFGSGRRIGVRGASILRLDRDGMKLEVVSRRIDPGPGTDDWPEYTGRPEP